MKVGCKNLNLIKMKEIISKKTLREFGLLIGFGFPVIIGWLLPAITGHGFRNWTIVIGLLGLIIGVISPRVLYYPYKFWMAIGHYLGWLNSRIILGLVFIVVLLPLAYLMRLFKYDPLRRKFNSETTYREIRKGQNIDINRIF